MTALDAWLRGLAKMKHYDPEDSLPEKLVTSVDEAHVLGPDVTGNSSEISVLLDSPAKTFEFYLQRIPPRQASDLQRHVAESVHFVIEGSGHSEIGPRVERWGQGDFVYTPPWVWHRHYNDTDADVRMLIVENSRLLEPLGLNRRESAGEVSYTEHRSDEERHGH